MSATDKNSAPVSLSDRLDYLERELTGLPDDHPSRAALEAEFRRVRRELFSTKL